MSETYRPWRACKRGHWERYASTGNCVGCHKLRNGRKKVTTEKGRQYHLKAKYGITVERYNELLSATAGRCPICTRQFDQSYLGRAVVDHCHTKGGVRSILCGACNQALGLFKESPAALRAAAIYLETHQA